jgi:hypothetical protein
MARNCTIPKCAEWNGGIRHRHPIADLNNAHILCGCGAANWILLTGGPLPAIVVCMACNATFNLSERLAHIGTPAARRARPV